MHCSTVSFELEAKDLVRLCTIVSIPTLQTSKARFLWVVCLSSKHVLKNMLFHFC